MKPIAGKTASLLLGGSLILLSLVGGEGAFAQSTEIRLFPPIAAVPSGFPTRSIEQAESYASESITLPAFDRVRQSAHISGGPDTLTKIAVDNFMTINHACRFAGDANICADRPFGSCFEVPGSDFRRAADVEEGVVAPQEFAIDQILTKILPVEVSDLIPEGGGRVDFTLCDFGAIRGNTELFLVIRDLPPRCSKRECKQMANDDLMRDINECMALAIRCAEDEFRSNCAEEEEACIMSATDIADAKTRPGGSCERDCPDD